MNKLKYKYETITKTKKKDKTIVDLIQSISEQFKIISGKPNIVKSNCETIKQNLSNPPSNTEINQIKELLPLLKLQSGQIVFPLFNILSYIVKHVKDPWSLLKHMLCARDKIIVLKVFESTVDLTVSGSLSVDLEMIRYFAEKIDDESNFFREKEVLKKIATIMNNFSFTGTKDIPDSVTYLYLKQDDNNIRRLAALALDIEGQPVSKSIAKIILGKIKYLFLAPYIEYTRATHLDLLYLQSHDKKLPNAFKWFQQVEELIGDTLLRKVISSLGWKRVNLGMKVQCLCKIKVEGSLPLIVKQSEAPLLLSCQGTQKISEFFLITTHGGLPINQKIDNTSNDVVARFRSYNLNHAELLTEILNVAPLTKKRTLNIISRMDKIVEDFVALFTSHSQECTILPAIYLELKEKIFKELKSEEGKKQLSAELTRLVQAFEDPKSIGEVQTLHGLKRYLHQQGLKLGFHLVESSREPNRTVDIIITNQSSILNTIKKIRYADFEPTIRTDNQTKNTPFPVSIVAEEFSRQLIFGHDIYPNVDIFCYGNEVHYYLAFRNHPAFLRIDFSPPIRGGMIDLEYFGVSNYDLTHHPNVGLDAIKLFFQKMDFDIQIDGTHIHARYDKERAIELESIFEKARAIFRFTPYLMDIDWIIGSLKLKSEARNKVAEAWAESFSYWGVLPVRQLITKNHSSILKKTETGPAGENDIMWNGEDEYQDIYSVESPVDFVSNLNNLLKKLEINISFQIEKDCIRPLGQLIFERKLLIPLRKAIRRGKLVETSQGLFAASPDLFQEQHETEIFSEILSSGKNKISAALGLTRLITPLEQALSFNTTGNIEGYDIQHADLALQGEYLSLFILKDSQNIIRMAFYTQDGKPYRHRKQSSAKWETNTFIDITKMATLLRSNNYIKADTEIINEDTDIDINNILKMIKSPIAIQRTEPLHGERIITGLRASPGRSVGKILFNTEGRTPENFNGAILVSSAVRPEDTTFLYHCAGIVSTGGGILSHAGLIAMQFQKPAMIISGRWQQETGSPPILYYKTLEYKIQKKKIHNFNICVYYDLLEQEYALHEGDLAALDAREGTFKILGQERDTLALYDDIRMLSKTNELIEKTKIEKDLLVMRGKRIVARHRIEKLISRLSNLILARYAVYELLLGEFNSEYISNRDDGIYLLKLLINNQLVGEDVRNYLYLIVEEIKKRFLAIYSKTKKQISKSICLNDIIKIRLEVEHHKQTLESAVISLKECGINYFLTVEYDTAEIEILSLRRIKGLRDELSFEIKKLYQKNKTDAKIRHLLRQLERVNLLLSSSFTSQKSIDTIRINLEKEDETRHKEKEQFYVVGPEDGGFELFPFIGWKAANLAEIERLGGNGLVPIWFAVTDLAFKIALDSPVNQITLPQEKIPKGAAKLHEAINAILAQSNLTNTQKSTMIQNLWTNLILPDKITKAVIESYRKIKKEVSVKENFSEDDPEPFVALRSSSHEEDAEIAARAGEFETYLFIHGENAIIDYLKRTWSGLWTERAIHNRFIMGTNSKETGGGVIIQRIINSRVSGVLQTVNVAKAEQNEIVINASLGLGEGVVSGMVNADQITVSKECDLEKGPLKFNYITSDKREQVVFNKRFGLGTILTETLYHQRLRPALEYVDLHNLVRIASRLEKAYGYPLDIEFGIEDERLWILQVRPVATFLSALNETLEHFPFNWKMFPKRRRKK